MYANHPGIHSRAAWLDLAGTHVHASQCVLRARVVGLWPQRVSGVEQTATPLQQLCAQTQLWNTARRLENANGLGLLPLWVARC